MKVNPSLSLSASCLVGHALALLKQNSICRPTIYDDYDSFLNKQTTNDNTNKSSICVYTRVCVRVCVCVVCVFICEQAIRGEQSAHFNIT